MDEKERIEITLDDLDVPTPPAPPSRAAAPEPPSPPAPKPLPGLPERSARREISFDAMPPRSEPPRSPGPAVSLGMVLEVIAGVGFAGLVVKLSIIGYYPDELPAIVIIGAILAVVGWVGRALDA